MCLEQTGLFLAGSPHLPFADLLDEPRTVLLANAPAGYSVLLPAIANRLHGRVDHASDHVLVDDE
jgi:hypothetical protein